MTPDDISNNVGINLSANKIQLTKLGEEKLKNKLTNLINEERPKVLVELSDARAQGDLSENADYDAAKNKQAEIEAEIQKIEDILTRVEIIEEIKGKCSKIRIGSTVTYLNQKTKSEKMVKIVGTIEANPIQEIPLIGDDSPVAKSLLGKEVGEKAHVETLKPYDIKVLKIN